MLLSVIVPAYNEEKTVEELLHRVFIVPIMKEVIVVNDASTDQTRAALDRAERNFNGRKSEYPNVKSLRIIHKETNAGKGAAIRTGIEHVTGDITLFQDADLELEPAEYPQLIEPILNWEADVVLGSRFRMEGPKYVYRFWHSMINKSFTMFSNMMTNLTLTDIWTCYKVFKTPILKSMKFESDRFGMEPELVALISKGNYTIYEVPVTYKARTKKQGKKIGFKDAINGIWVILKFNVFK